MYHGHVRHVPIGLPSDGTSWLQWHRLHAHAIRIVYMYREEALQREKLLGRHESSSPARLLFTLRVGG